MPINRKQLEAISNSAQNDAIALAEVYRESFTKRLNSEIETALNQELFGLLNDHAEVAQTIVNSIAHTYADNIVNNELTFAPVKLLKPKRERLDMRCMQALLPPEKPQLKVL